MLPQYLSKGGRAHCPYTYSVLLRDYDDASGLTLEQESICMKHIKKIFRERVTKEAKRIAMKVY